MILVSASSDYVTGKLAEYANLVAGQFGAAVDAHAHDERAVSVRATLRANSSRGIFFFVHGHSTPPSIVDGFGSVIVDIPWAGYLAHRIVVGTCYSLDQLGQALAAAGATVVGYTGKLEVPNDPTYADEMCTATVTPHLELLNGGDAANAAKAGGAEYHKLARTWFARRHFTAIVLGGWAVINGNRIGVLGNVGAVL